MVHPIPAADLPENLRVLNELALDAFWTWSHAGDELWRAMDRKKWDLTQNPWVILQDISRERLDQLAADPSFRRELQRVAEERDGYLNKPCWFQQAHKGAEIGTIAYFSMEFGLGEALPLYAGGLGILAGDYLKAASDVGAPIVGVGLLYYEGYFRQFVDAEGRQQEVYTFNDPTSLPVQPVMSPAGGWLEVTIDLPGRSLALRVWQVQVGRTTLYLLDSNDPINSPTDRGITSKLYGGGLELRLLQEIVLGVGGWRALQAMGINVDICHLNEGHAGLVVLERARCNMESSGLSFPEALWATRPGNVFTTHTPADSGFDRFPAEMLAKYVPLFCGDVRLGISLKDLLALGRKDPDDEKEPFNMAYLAVRGSSTVNGVSRLHGEVSRRLFEPLFPRWPRPEVPIGHVTNGIHVPSWDSPWADKLWTDACGKGRWLDTFERLPEEISCIEDEALWTFRTNQRARLVERARARLAMHLGQRGAEPDQAAKASQVLDPNALTLGMARRFTDYKRPNLLLSDPERLMRMLTNARRPVQIIAAGKAHPDDRAGKNMVTEWMDFIEKNNVRDHVVFLEDYDIALAQELVQGADVWINTPRRPWEACGTSGMKVLVNGGLNLSELDGWWVEAYSPEFGWALGDGHEHAEPGYDAVEAGELYRLLEEEVIPEFYDRDQGFVPRKWVARMRASMANLAPHFSSNRMLREYMDTIYLPSVETLRRRTAQADHLAKELCRWHRSLAEHWDHIRFGDTEFKQAGDRWQIDLQVYLGEIDANDVRVEFYSDATGGRSPIRETMERISEIPGSVNGHCYHAAVPSARDAQDYTARVVPYHPDASVPIESNLIKWQR